MSLVIKQAIMIEIKYSNLKVILSWKLANSLCLISYSSISSATPSIFTITEFVIQEIMKIETTNKMRLEQIPIVGKAKVRPIFFKKIILMRSVMKNIKLK